MPAKHAEPPPKQTVTKTWQNQLKPPFYYHFTGLVSEHSPLSKKRGRHSISWLFSTIEFTLRSRYISFHRGEANSARLSLVCEIYFPGAKRKLESRDPCCALTSVLPRTLCSLGDLGTRRSGKCVTGGISIVDEAVGVTSRIVGRWADSIDM